MVATIRGKVKNLKTAFMIMSGKSSDKYILFDQIVLKATEDKLTSMSMTKGRGIVGAFEFFNFDVKIDDEEEMLIPINVPKIFNYLNKLASSDTEIIITYDGKTFLLKTEMDDASIAGVTIDSVETNLDKFPFKFDEKTKTALYKNGKVKPTTTIELDAEILKGLIVRAELTDTDYYPIEFQEPNKIIARCGDEKDRRNDSIKHRRNDLIVTGEPCKVVLSQGFREVFGVLDGMIRITGKTGYPIWVYQETPDYTAGFLMAPRKESK